MQKVAVDMVEFIRGYLDAYIHARETNNLVYELAGKKVEEEMWRYGLLVDPSSFGGAF